MKKIMFNDKYGLTKAVIEGRKTQTRRIIPQATIDKIMEVQTLYYEATFDNLEGLELFEYYFYWHIDGDKKFPYNVGEIVAVAQSYEVLGYSPDALDRSPKDWRIVRGTLGESKGWNNKMFVRAEACKHQIRITDVRIERLQDISDEDCLKEGIETFFYGNCKFPPDGYTFDGGKSHFDNPRETFAHLINKVSRKDVWGENPYVFVYDFELVK